VVAIWAFLKPVTKFKDVLSGLVGGKIQLCFVVVVLSVVANTVVSYHVAELCSQSLLVRHSSA